MLIFFIDCARITTEGKRKVKSSNHTENTAHSPGGVFMLWGERGDRLDRALSPKNPKDPEKSFTDFPDPHNMNYETEAS